MDNAQSQHRTPHSSLVSTSVEPRKTAGQKRAYHKRRKDPSCDACRDRKVKCDATDDSCCSECAARGVICRFTKETNRRASAMRQIRELQGRLKAARREVVQLRSALDRDEPERYRSTDWSVQSSTPQARDTQAIAGSGVNLPEVRRNMSIHGTYLFRASALHGRSTTEAMSNVLDLYLPAAKTMHSLLSRYLKDIHSWCPILDWRSFESSVNKVYTAHSTAVPPGWVAIFYTVLACGAIAHDNKEDIVSQDERMRLLHLATDWVHRSRQEMSPDSIIATELLAIAYMEIGSLDECAIWHAVAVRMSQASGPYPNSGATRQTWQCICLLDALVALELSLPALISADDHCRSNDPPYTRTEDEQAIEMEPTTLESTSRAILSTVSLLNRASGTPKPQAIPNSAIEAVTTPPSDNTGDSLAPQYAELLTLAPRLMLHRHNMHPAFEQPQRQDALRSCVAIAKATDRQMRHERSQSADNARSLPSFACRHLWRCTLLLCLAGEHSTARAMVDLFVQASLSSSISRACCRYIRFFLQQMLDRAVRSGILRIDEELIAYASADQQQSAHGSWIWAEEKPEGDWHRAEGYAPSPYSASRQTTRDEDWREVHELLAQLEQYPAQPWTLTGAPPAETTATATANIVSPKINRISISDII